MVEVKLPQTSSENDDLAEDEYLNSFRFDNTIMRKKIDESDLLNSSSEIEEDDEGNNINADSLSDDEDEIVEFGNIVEEDEDEEDEEVIREKPLQIQNDEENLRNKLKNSFENNNLNNNNNNNVNDDLDEDDDIEKSLFTNIKSIRGDKIKLKKNRNRPTVIGYYSNMNPDSNPSSTIYSSVITKAAPASAAKTINQNENEKDIDETFDFLNDEELN